jgi:hypothetical protein
MLSEQNNLLDTTQLFFGYSSSLNMGISNVKQCDKMAATSIQATPVVKAENVYRCASH